MKVKTMLMFHQNVSGLKTHVDVLDGVVTLQGEASSEAQKELTTEYAKYIEGVKNVKNDMTVVKSKKTTVDKVGEFIDDASITAQVKLRCSYIARPMSSKPRSRPKTASSRSRELQRTAPKRTWWAGSLAI